MLAAGGLATPRMEPDGTPRTLCRKDRWQPPDLPRLAGRGARSLTRPAMPNSLSHVVSIVAQKTLVRSLHLIRAWPPQVRCETLHGLSQQTRRNKAPARFQARSLIIDRSLL